MAAEHVVHHVPIYQDPTFWVAMAFVAVLALFGRRLFRGLKTAMAVRAEKIRTKISDSSTLRDEVRANLVECQHRNKGLDDEIKRMIAQAKSDAARLRQMSETDLVAGLAARERHAKDRLALTEETLIADMREKLVDLSLSAATKIIVQNVKNLDHELVSAAVRELPARIVAGNATKH